MVSKASVLNCLGGGGGVISLHYIYKQCNGMQGLCAQLKGGSSAIYISSVVVCKASVIDCPGGVNPTSLYI